MGLGRLGEAFRGVGYMVERGFAFCVLALLSSFGHFLHYSYAKVKAPWHQ